MAWRQDGFSLIEAVIAAGLVAGVCVALAQLLAMSIASNTSARDRSAAIVIAAQKMEQLRALPWGEASNGEDYVDQSGAVGESPVAAGGVFVRRWSVEPVPASLDTVALHVSVAQSGRQSARLVTLKSRTP